MASLASEDGDIGFQIAPMVDVVFVLMLFFMASAGAQVIERELSINLPSGKAATTSAPVTPIVIAIAPDGSIQINGAPYEGGDAKDLTQTRDWLKATVDQFGAKDPVIIQPDPQARHERIVQVLNACAAAGVKNLSFS